MPRSVCIDTGFWHQRADERHRTHLS